MPLINSTSRSQLQMICLDEKITPDSLARVIDAFINSADIEHLGFIVKGKSFEGRPAYASSTLLKLYLYGYLNSIRSSRKLEQECSRNIELWWLLNNQVPNYKTIANFRKDNSKAFKKLFSYFRDFCIALNLYGKTTIAIDGSKFRAQNAKKNNYNTKKIQQHLDYIEDQTQEYLKELEDNDVSESSGARMQNLQDRKNKYLNLQKQINDSDQLQISTSDPDARALPLKMNIVEVAYNLQTSVDDKHNLIADFEVTNYRDSESLAPLSINSKKAFGLGQENSLTVLADKGYYKGQQIQECHLNNIDTLVAIRSKPNKNKAAHVRKDKFVFNKKEDSYTCPKGITLNRQGTFYKRKIHGKLQYRFARYIADFRDCSKCPYLNDCVTKSNQKVKRGRLIDRSEYEEARETNDLNFKSRKNEYKRRQAIVEHPFGTIKRQWGFTHTLLKGLKNVHTEFSIILLCYNLKRVVSILGTDGFLKAICKPFLIILAMARLVELHVKINFLDHHPAPYSS